MATMNPYAPPPQKQGQAPAYTGAPPKPQTGQMAPPAPMSTQQGPLPAPVRAPGALPAPGGPGGAPGSPSASALRGFNEVDSSKPLSWWQEQDKYLDPNATGYARYRSAKVDANGKPIEGLFEHPDACPEGMTAFGQNQCLSVDDPRVAPYLHGPSGPGGPGGAPEGWTADHAAYLKSLTDLADQMRQQGQQYFGAAMPAIGSSAGYWSKLLGSRSAIQSATAPAAEQIAAGYRGAQKQVRNLRGADKSAAVAELARGEAGDVGRLGAEQQQTAAAQLGDLGTKVAGLGLQAGGQAAQIGESQQSDATQRWGAQLSSDTQKWLGDLSARTSWNIASLNAGVSREQLAQNSQLAWASLQQHGDEFAQTFAQNARQWQDQLGLEQQKIQYQKDKDKGSFLGGLFGTVFKAITNPVSLFGQNLWGGGGGDQ